MWFKRPFRSVSSSTSHRSALRPWGDAAYLSPYHLPLCIEGNRAMVEVATTRLFVELQAQRTPIFLQEGLRAQVSRWEQLNVPPGQVLPPLQAGTTQETVQQTLLELTDWLALRAAQGAPTCEWPALLVCSNLGTQRKTVMNVLKAMNQSRSCRLGLVYVQDTKAPPLEKQEFMSQLYCHPDGKAILRRGHNHQRLQLDNGPVPLMTARQVRPQAHKSMG